MKKNIFLIALCFIAGAALVGPALATSGDIDFYESGAIDSYTSGQYTTVTAYPYPHFSAYQQFYINNWNSFQGTELYLEMDINAIFNSSLSSGEGTFTVKNMADSSIIGLGTVYYSSGTNTSHFTWHITDWNPPKSSAQGTFKLFENVDPYNLSDGPEILAGANSDAAYPNMYCCLPGTDPGIFAGYYAGTSGKEFAAFLPVDGIKITLYKTPFEQSLSYETNDLGYYYLSFYREGILNTVIVQGVNNDVYYQNSYEEDDFDILCTDTVLNVTVQNPATGTYFYETIGDSEEGEEEDGSNVSVYTQFRDVISGANIPGAVAFEEGGNYINFSFPSGYGYSELVKNVNYNTTATSPGFETIEQENLFSGDSGLMFWMEPTYTGGEANETVYNLVVQGEGAGALAGAQVTIQGVSTKITNSNGAAQFNLLKYTPYVISASYSGFIPFTQTINITQDSYTDYVSLLVDSEGPYATPTPTPDPDTGESGESATYIDLRTNEEKTEDALAIWFDNTEVIAQLALMVVILSLIGWLIPKKRR